ncbi:hypothetical protein SDC9_128476 [bioreactor metagenome]|uniref:Uncharacterized protein n=1 Tax=bioreactor metagenome TaxID=1076179 RepID=A0A645CX19_9ZZZZ
MIIKKHNFFITDIQDGTHTQNEQNNNRGDDAGQGNVQGLLPAPRTINNCRFVQFLVHRG